MTDIVERLRKWSVFGYGYEASCDMKEAATAIEAQRANMANAARLLSEQTAEIERLRAALRLAQRGLDPYATYETQLEARVVVDGICAALEERT